MSIPHRLRDYLESQHVDYEWLPHAEAFTAKQAADSLHVPMRRFSKTVLLEADGRLVMAVLPAAHHLSPHDLKALLGARHLVMLPEGELTKRFPDCELGAVPPFGNLYGIDVHVDRAVAESDEIFFVAGTHWDAVRMKYSDFAALVKPHVGQFSQVWLPKAA